MRINTVVGDKCFQSLSSFLTDQLVEWQSVRLWSQRSEIQILGRSNRTVSPMARNRYDISLKEAVLPGCNDTKMGSNL